MPLLTLKAAHSISCELNRVIETNRSAVSTAPIQIVPSPDCNVDALLGSKYKRIVAAYSGLFEYKKLYHKLRDAINDANSLQIVVNSVVQPSIRSMTAEIAAHTSIIQLLTEMKEALGSVSDEEIDTAKLVAASSVERHTYLHGTATDAQVSVINTQINEVKSSMAKIKANIDRANNTNTIEITVEEFAILEKLGLA